MQILTDALLSLLAAVGLWELGRLALERFFAPGGREPAVWAVVRARGDGGGLEQPVHTLPRLGWGVVLVDCGRDEQGRALASRLARRDPGVQLCRWERLGAWMKEAEVWTRQGSTTK